MYPWFLMNAPTVVITIIVAVLVFVSSSKFRFERKPKNVILFAPLALLLLYCATKYNIYGILTSIVSVYITYVLCTLSDKYQRETLKYITDGMAIILLISIPFYILYFIGVPLLHDTILFGKDVSLDNYYFFVKYSNDIRFQSIFLEPGHMTMGIAPLLFLNRYDYKKKSVLVIIVAQLMSMSLAGIIVMMAGLLFTVLLRPSVSSRIKGSIMVLLCFGVLVSFMYVFYGGDIIQTLILNRLEIKNGQLAGYNRTSLEVDYMFESLVSSDSRWFGLGENSLILGSGYKIFILQNGLIGAFFGLLAYIMPFLLKKNMAMLVFCAILLMLLYQNGYPQWWCMMISLILGPAYYENMKKKRVLNNNGKYEKTSC